MLILDVDSPVVKQIAITGELIVVGAEIDQERMVCDDDVFLVTESELRRIVEDSVVSALS